MISVKNLIKSFNGFQAVNDLSFDVKPGEVVGFLGPNGAGKSTTMKMLTGFLLPSSGEIHIGDLSIADSALAIKRKIGYLPEVAPLYSDMRVKDYLVYVCRLKLVERIKVMEYVETVLDQTSLKSVENTLISHLSKGYRQRVGIAQAIVHQPDLIILDVMIPKIDGYVVCETIRLENSQVPILFLSAKNSAEDKINGLKTGADDYMAKPFNLEEFLLRVSVLVKRSHALAESNVEELNQFEFGENKVDFGSFEITTWDGDVKSLSKREMKLLKLLIEKRGKVVSREEILQKIWGYDVFPSTRTIDNYILAFRKYFEKNQRQPKYFFSVRGVGYKFESED